MRGHYRVEVEGNSVDVDVHRISSASGHVDHVGGLQRYIHEPGI